MNFKYHSADWEEEYPLITSAEHKPTGYTPRGGRGSFYKQNSAE
jgi:hypothetical protein